MGWKIKLRLGLELLHHHDFNCHHNHGLAPNQTLVSIYRLKCISWAAGHSIPPDVCRNVRSVDVRQVWVIPVPVAAIVEPVWGSGVRVRPLMKPPACEHEFDVKVSISAITPVNHQNNFPCRHMRSEISADVCKQKWFNHKTNRFRNLVSGRINPRYSGLNIIITLTWCLT